MLDFYTVHNANIKLAAGDPQTQNETQVCVYVNSSKAAVFIYFIYFYTWFFLT